MLAAVGSTSPSKVRATRAVFRRAFPDAQVETVSVGSGVRPQPIGDDETIQGAERRARGAREALDADMGIGIEGGLHPDARGAWMCIWVAVSHRDGRQSLGGGLRLRVPAWLADRALAGEEVGVIVDTLLESEDAHEALGVIGLLTGGLVDRQGALEQALAVALAPFIAPSFFAPRGGPKQQPG